MTEETEAARAAGVVAEHDTKLGRTFMRPLGDRVLVIEDDSPTTTASGIHLVETARGETRRGIVVAHGPGLRGPLTGEPVGIGLHEGDKVIFSPMTGIEITVDGQKILVLHESDVISVYSVEETDGDE